ncbi:hydrolase, partial [Streptomyces sp. ZEA17I]
LEDAPPGAAAARAAGMRCIAVPYVPATASDPAFATADLLFAQGQSAFTAEAAFGWLLGGAGEPVRPSGPGAGT